MQLTYITDGYDRCRQRKLPLTLNDEWKLYYPDDSYNDPRQDIWATYMDGRWSMGLEVEISRRDQLGMFSCFSLLCFSSWISAQCKWRRHGFLPPSESVKWRWSFPVRRIHRKVTLRGTDRLWDLWIHMIAYVERLFDCFLSISFLSYSCTGLCSPGGLHLKRAIMEWHGCTRRVQGRVTPDSYSRLATSLRSLAIILSIHLHLQSLESTFATISTQLPYVSLRSRAHAYVPLQYIKEPTITWYPVIS